MAWDTTSRFAVYAKKISKMTHLCLITDLVSHPLLISIEGSHAKEQGPS